MAKQNDPAPGKWAFTPGGKDKADRMHAELGKQIGGPYPGGLKALQQQYDAARKGRN